MSKRSILAKNIVCVKLGNSYYAFYIKLTYEFLNVPAYNSVNVITVNYYGMLL